MLKSSNKPYPLKYHRDLSEHRALLKYGLNSPETSEMLYLQNEIMQREPIGSSLSTISPNIDE
jgi:hypothetical protein